MTTGLLARHTPRALRAIAVAVLTAAAVTAALTAGTARAAAAGCRTGGLVVWIDTQGNGAAGTIFYTLNLTNLSGRACTLRGYPGVSAIGLSGRMLGSPATRLTGHAVRTVTIANGRTAHATLGIVDTGALPNCHMTTAAGLRVFAPGQTVSRSVPFPFPACANRGPGFLRIGPVT